MKFESIIVKVTQEDIDKGIKNDPCNCPVALALKKLSWTPDKIQIVNGVCLPGSAVDFIYRFDNNLRTKPFELKIAMQPHWGIV